MSKQRLLLRLKNDGCTKIRDVIGGEVLRYIHTKYIKHCWDCYE